ncbi:hypothetical protein O181_114383 [Austropuccinia psidii MF-1]|uniref:Reverse transcriptase/retrotransposon-derived protein RNase H-like domain-containing protein n=1 Tax=Austropuccinia psidii MF-1 TaxID=1389203 RepID=A0A9Q3PUI1_9BASI|nr:hypothetical protein [Austropuccinia psidii MF-1]
MDLPPLSFHASLEEETEEIKTVLKVVPPVYNQYLDLFSKVKAEKIPPHHTCDHHIKLERSLPPEPLSQFKILEEAFTTAPILSHFNHYLPTIIETDASDYALDAVLSKELLARVWALKSWRAFLISVSHSFEVLKDHYSLQYFMSSKVLTCCQASWDEFLSEFHLTITYNPGRLDTLPDALSPWDNVYPERG